MKKTLSRLTIGCLLVLGLFALIACDTPKNEKKTIVCTIFPQYDWVKEILGERLTEFDVVLLMQNGSDLHNYDPTPIDIITIGASDLFVYTGGVSDDWVEGVLKKATNKNMKTLALLDQVEAKMEEPINEEHDHDHEHDHGEGEHHEHGHYDEHVWLSVKNAQIIVGKICEAICDLDHEHLELYQENATNYNQKLAKLDQQFEEAVNNAKLKTLLFGDRFPFRYFVDDYHLNYNAAFSGCSAETEATFETIIFLARKVDELNLPAVLVIESSDKLIAQTIISSTQTKNQKMLVMNSCQSVTKEDISKGVSYLSIMQANLSVLTEALN